MSGERGYRDEAAATFDDEPDHGLRHPMCGQPGPSSCFPSCRPRRRTSSTLAARTGSLCVLLAEAGQAVRGVDFSEPMVTAPRRKARALPATFVVGDAADPPFETGSAGVVLARHVLWAMADRADPDAWF